MNANSRTPPLTPAPVPDHRSVGRTGERLAVRARRLYDGEVLYDGPVLLLIENGHILDVDRTGAPPPDGYTTLDLGDATLLPGLIDAHTHLVWDPFCNAPKDLSHAPVSVLLGRARCHAGQALRAGVTTVRDLGDRHFATLQLRAEYQAGIGQGPELLTAGPPLTCPQGHCWFLGGEADTTEELEAAVRMRAARGTDWVKVMATGGFVTPGSDPLRTQFTQEQLTAVVTTAHAHGLPVTAHAHTAEGILRTALAGAEGVEHCTFATPQGPTADPQVIDTLAVRGVWAGCTIVRAEDLPEAAAGWAEQYWHNVVAMVRAGVRVALSTDAGVSPSKPHDMLPSGLAYASAHGLSNRDVLTAATAGAARSCGVGDRKGRLAPGYDADLLAVSGHPLHDLRTLTCPQVVLRAGRLVTPSPAPPTSS